MLDLLVDDYLSITELLDQVHDRPITRTSLSMVNHNGGDSCIIPHNNV